MYLTEHSISCLRAFLDGWYLRDPESVTEGSVLADFQDWIVEKYKVKSSHGWSQIIRFYSQDDYDALDRFFELFESWLKASEDSKSDDFVD